VELSKQLNYSLRGLNFTKFWTFTYEIFPFFKNASNGVRVSIIPPKPEGVSFSKTSLPTTTTRLRGIVLGDIENCKKSFTKKTGIKISDEISEEESEKELETEVINLNDEEMGIDDLPNDGSVEEESEEVKLPKNVDLFDKIMTFFN
jgi:hypothetical protein